MKLIRIPEQGERRVIRKFAWFPRPVSEIGSAGGKFFVWLQHVYLMQSYDYFPFWITKDTWDDVPIYSIERYGLEKVSKRKWTQ